MATTMGKWTKADTHNATPEEVAAKMIELQNSDPLMTETALTLELCVNDDYIRRNSERHEPILRARKVCRQIREKAWVQKGMDMMDHSDPNRKVNPTIYVWLTKNMLGWRDEPQQTEDTDEPYQEP